MELLSALNTSLKGPREIYADLMGDTSKIDKILEAGAAKVRPQAQKLVNELKQTVGVK